jgi:hypothetical protein
VLPVPKKDLKLGLRGSFTSFFRTEREGLPEAACLGENPERASLAHFGLPETLLNLRCQRARATCAFKFMMLAPAAPAAADFAPPPPRTVPRAGPSESCSSSRFGEGHAAGATQRGMLRHTTLQRLVNRNLFVHCELDPGTARFQRGLGPGPARPDRARRRAGTRAAPRARPARRPEPPPPARERGVGARRPSGPGRFGPPPPPGPLPCPPPPAASGPPSRPIRPPPGTCAPGGHGGGHVLPVTRPAQAKARRAGGGRGRRRQRGRGRGRRRGKLAGASTPVPPPRPPPSPPPHWHSQVRGAGGESSRRGGRAVAARGANRRGAGGEPSRRGG